MVMTLDLAEYRRFITGKHARAEKSGFTPRDLPSRLFDHQAEAVTFALERGKSALFLDTGLGKSGCEVVFADQCVRHTNKPALLFTPLAVARQMQREAESFGVEAKVVKTQADCIKGVNIANYERLPHLDPAAFGAVVLDESSILKSFTGLTKRALTELFAATPYRVAATATPAPNDHMEIGQHGEFLSVMPSSEMLSRWFISDQSKMGAYRLKGHAEADFWSWVASWARAASMPSDLGGDDTGFILPPLHHVMHIVGVDVTQDTGDLLFRIPDNSATSIHREKKLTLQERAEKAASIANEATGPVVVWCERDDESAWITRLIPDAIEVKGSMTVEGKEAGLDAFTFGHARVLVSKPKLAGFGLNWQHCNTQVFASINHSYESYYQAVRRCWRFGQKREVTAHIVLAETERPISANVRRKASDHDRMKAAMAQAMRRAQNDASGVSRYGALPKFTFLTWFNV